MKNKQPAKSHAIVLSQLCKLIPQHLVAKIARKTLHPTAGNVLLSIRASIPAVDELDLRQKGMSQHPPILKGYHRNNILIAIVPVLIGVACGLWAYHRQEAFAAKDNLQMVLGYGFIFGVCAFVLAIVRMGFGVPKCLKCKSRCKRIRALRITESGAWGTVTKSWWSVFRCTQCRSSYRVSGRY